MKNIFFTVMLVALSVSGFSQARRLLGLEPGSGRPGYIYRDTLRSLNLTSPLFNSNDTTISIDTSRFTIASFAKNAARDSTVLTMLNGTRYAVLDSFTSVAGAFVRRDGTTTMTGVWDMGTLKVWKKYTAATANTHFEGFVMSDSTTASSGNQMYSPSFTLEGQGWKTTATAASQSVRFRQAVVPIQGTTAPTGNLNFDISVNGAGYSNGMVLSSSGFLGIGTTAPSTKLHVLSSTRTLIEAPSGSVSGILLQPNTVINSGTWAIDARGTADVTNNRFLISNQGLAGGNIAQFVILNSGQVGISYGAPTAMLHLKQGTSEALKAPLKFTYIAPITTTAASGAASVVTLTFAAQPVIPFPPGSTIVVAGVTPAGYNGTFVVTGCTTTTVSYTNATTGAQTVAGTITLTQKLATPENGAMEYDGTNLFFTRSGTTRESIISANAVNSVSPTAQNRTITVVIDGTTYYLSAKTTND